MRRATSQMQLQVKPGGILWGFQTLSLQGDPNWKTNLFFFSNNEETFWEKIEVFLCLVGQEIGNKSFFVSIVFFVTPLVMPQCTQRFPVVSNNDCSGWSCSRGEGKIKSLSLWKIVRIFYYCLSNQSLKFKCPCALPHNSSVRCWLS